METDLITLFQNLPLAGAIGLIGYFLIKDVLAPLTRMFVNRRNGVSSNIEKRIDKVQNNDLHDITRRLGVLEDNDRRFEDRLNKMGEDLAYLKARLNGRN